MEMKIKRNKIFKDFALPSNPSLRENWFISVPVSRFNDNFIAERRYHWPLYFEPKGDFIECKINSNYELHSRYHSHIEDSLK